jgi:hypothetical protein
VNAPSCAAAPKPPSQQLGRMVLFSALAMLALGVLNTVVTLPGAVTAESFLSLGSARIDELQAISSAWARLVVFHAGVLNVDLQEVSIAYLSLDTVFFVPLYGALLLEIARLMGGSRARLLGGLTVALMAVDLIENAAGLAKLSVVAGATGSTATRWEAIVAAALAFALGYAFWNRQTAGNRILGELSAAKWENARLRWRQAMTATLIFVVAIIVAAALAGAGVASGALTKLLVSSSLGSHVDKQVLLGLVAVVLLAAGLGWLFRPSTPHADIGAVRRGIADIVLRTRYVLIVLAVFIGLTLGLDQSRDVAIGIADAMLSRDAGWAWPSFALTVLAVWALSFSCWLWARLVCRMPGTATSPRTAISGAAREALQNVARGTARVLGLAPPFVVAVMSGLAARDAVWAAAYSRPPVVLTPLLLLLCGAVSLLGAVLFLWGREDAGRKVKEVYYDDPALDGNWMTTIAAEKYRFMWGKGPGPTALAVLALLTAIAVRCLVSVVETHVPLAVCVIVLTLVAWLGFLGWLSLKERREARPWALAIIVVAAAIGYCGFADNHIVRIVRADSSGILPAPGAQILGTLLLATCVVVAATVLVRNAIKTQAQRPAGLAWGWVLTIAAVVGIAVLIGVDRLSYRPSPFTAIPFRPTLDQAFDQWADVLVKDRSVIDSDGRHVFLVTSEGGGIRAAYWTARVLRELRQHLAKFDDRTFMMSGVSGGAVGEAVYVGCDSGDSSGAAVEDAALLSCINRFGRSDILTPMIGAWLFEDALARVLPTSLPKMWGPRATLCIQPGCGFLSRGLWFEQALERAVPRLRTGIVSLEQPRGARVPQLFLNSTWVETGDRAVASAVRVDWSTSFPEALDQLGYAAEGGPQSPRPPVDMPLSAAAHNSGRFTFVNAIGVLRNAGDQAGHLADGGYFDNSGSHTAIDVLVGFRSWLDGVRCTQRGAETCAWLRTLRPRILVIQNGITVNCDFQDASPAQLDCLRRQWRIAPDLKSDPIYDPGQPAASSRLRLFADLAGPLVAFVNVGGTGGNGRRAEALMQAACRKFLPAEEYEDDQQDCAVQIAQRTDGVLYPLGWYLSPTAREALDKKASCEVRVQVMHEERCKTGAEDCDCRRD